MGTWVVKMLGDGGGDFCFFSSDETEDTHVYPLLTFGLVAQEKGRRAEGGCLLRDAAAVGEDEGCLGEEVAEGVGVDGVGECDGGKLPEGFFCRLSNGGVGVHRKEKDRIGARF